MKLILQKEKNNIWSMRHLSEHEQKLYFSAEIQNY